VEAAAVASPLTRPPTTAPSDRRGEPTWTVEKVREALKEAGSYMPPIFVLVGPGSGECPDEEWIATQTTARLVFANGVTAGGCLQARVSLERNLNHLGFWAARSPAFVARGQDVVLGFGWRDELHCAVL
jgi:hypothetical protein